MQTGKTAICLGSTGFIGHHLARRLKKEGYWVRVVDRKEYEYGVNDFADEIIIGDLRDPRFVQSVLRLNEQRVYSYSPLPFEKQIQFDECYQLACEMGGAGYVFSGEHDADIMSNSALININVATWASIYGVKKLFYSSSACMYPQEIQNGERYIAFGGNFMGLKESDAYPANPDSEYGWEKLFSERLYLAYARNYGLNIRIARFHNIYGPEGTYTGGREKAPAAMCRKVIECLNFINENKARSDSYKWEELEYAKVEVWGDGQQTRSFLYIDDCIDAVRLLMESDFKEPINIGSEEMVSINELAQMAIDISGKDIKIKNVPSNALGVRGRNSDNTLIRQVLNWEPKHSLKEGLTKTYSWIKETIENGIHTK